MPKKLKSYHFDCGNSNTGPVGFCARIIATSKKEALKILHEVMPEEIEIHSHFGCSETVEYIHIYTGTENVKISDIDDWEYVDDEELEDDD
jgi:predicted NAD/FAD-binding protein